MILDPKKQDRLNKEQSVRRTSQPSSQRLFDEKAGAARRGTGSHRMHGSARDNENEESDKEEEYTEDKVKDKNKKDKLEEKGDQSPSARGSYQTFSRKFAREKVSTHRPKQQRNQKEENGNYDNEIENQEEGGRMNRLGPAQRAFRASKDKTTRDESGEIG